MNSLANLLSRRPWRVVAIAVAFLAVAVMIGGPLTGNLSSAGFEDPSAEFVAARDTIRHASGVNPNPGVIALVSPGSDVRAGEGRQAVETAAATIRKDPDVGQVVTAFDGGGAAMISTDGTQSYIAVFMKPISDDAAGDAAKRIRESLESQPVKVGGADAVGDEVGTIIGEDLAKAEMFALEVGEITSQEPLDNVDRLAEPCLPFRHTRPSSSDDVLVQPLAGTKAEREPVVAQKGQGRGTLRDDCGMIPHGWACGRGHQVEAFGGVRDGAKHRPGHR